MTKKKMNREVEDNRDKTNAGVKKKQTTIAHDQADKDIEKDPDLTTKPQKGDDLDEGELARLEGED
jgi:hypothetical protein